jgi:hypothetical protein
MRVHNGPEVADRMHTRNLRLIWGEPPPENRTPAPLAGGARDRFENGSNEYPLTTHQPRLQSAAVLA